MRHRIKAYSRDYYLWLYGLYHSSREHGTPTYKGLYHHTEQSLNKIYNLTISEIIKQAP